MIHTYSKLTDDFGNNISERTKLFVSEVSDDGTINRFQSGLIFSTEESGTLFIVDKWVIDQIDKVKFLNGVLSVKENEELIPPVKTEKELQREELLKQLAELELEPSE